jgi:hypothetical protein
MARWMWDNEPHDRVYRAIVTVSGEPDQDLWAIETWSHTFMWGPYGSHGAAAGVATAKARRYLNQGCQVTTRIEESVVSWTESS